MSGDGNFLIAVAVVLLILVILYGSGCMLRDNVPAPPAAMNVAPTATPPVTTSAASADGKKEFFSLPSMTSAVPTSQGTVITYEFNAPHRAERPELGENFTLPSLGTRAVPASATLREQRLSEKTDRDLANLFKSEHLSVNPTEIKFAAEKLPNTLFRKARPAKPAAAKSPLLPDGAQRRKKSKNYKKEQFVDANGRWQSFMYYHVGNDGDPRPLSDYIDGKSSQEAFSVSELVGQTQAGLSQAYHAAMHRAGREHLSDLPGARQIKTPDGRCLGIVDGRAGTTLGVSSCQPMGGDNMQGWLLEANPASGYQIQARTHVGDSYCVTRLPGGEVGMVPCVGTSQQSFSVVAPNKFVKGPKQLKSASGQCLRIENGPLGVNPTLGKCGDASSQWVF